MRNGYDKNSGKPFKLSRSKIDLFVECPRCFYLDRVSGVGRPPGFPFSLNSAVDKLLKQEFDIHRAAGTRHPLQKRYSIDAVPAAHEELNIWRENFKGIQFLYEPANFIITGAIDDLWISKKKEYIIVDYKATAKAEQVVALDKEWQDGYKRQMEIYQWLLRQRGFAVADTGYFVYANASKDREAFDATLEFEVTLIPYTGSTGWVEATLLELKKCLDSEVLPLAGEGCDYCQYRESVSIVTTKYEKGKTESLF